MTFTFLKPYVTWACKSYPVYYYGIHLNGMQQKDIHQNNINHDTQHFVLLSALKNVAVLWCYAECPSVQCHCML